jgi:hypothetical protein
VRPQTPSPVRGLLGRRLAAVAGAGPEVDDAVRVAAEVVASGATVALEHVPAAGAADPAAELRRLVAGVARAGLAASCQLTVPVDRLGAPTAAAVAEAALDAGLGVALAGATDAAAPLAARFPDAAVVVTAGRPGAEQCCRTLAGGRVRLTEGRGTAADLAFVRCLTVLMAGPGRPSIGTTDPRLVAIAGERAAWNERAPESWEYVMPWKVRTGQQRRLVAGGYAARVAVPSGEGTAPAALRRLVGRS